MKKLLALFLLVFMFSCSKVDTSNQTEFLFYIIENQEDVDEFKATKIFGNLEINGEDIHDLSGLSTLTTVGAIVIRNTQLTDLQGLHNVQNLTGKVHLENNPLLEDVTALTNIGNQIITLNVIKNPSLNDLTGLNIAVDADQLHLEEIPIEHLDVFTNINHINTLNLFYLPELSSVEGLTGLRSIDDQLLLEGLPVLFSLEGFNNVHTISTDLKIIDLNISDFQGLNGLVTCKSIDMRDLTHLQSMSGFDSLEYVPETISIKDCTFLLDFDGFPSLNSTKGITIDNLYSLISISGLQNLNVILNDLVIVENNSLTDFCGLQTFLMNGGLGGDYVVNNNAYNPTQQDIIEGNCSL